MERREQDPGQIKREAFERSDGIGSIMTRGLWGERMGIPSERETKEALVLITSEFLNPVLEMYTKGKILKKFKETASKAYGYPLSAPHLSAEVINAIAVALRDDAIEDFKNNELSSIKVESIVAYDVSMGIMEVLSTIIDAENTIRGSFDNESLRRSSEYPAGTLSLSQEADIFLNARVKALDYSKLLREDPTGKSLVRHAVEEVENPERKLAPNLRELVVHGATFAERAYAVMYPLAAKMNNPT